MQHVGVSSVRFYLAFMLRGQQDLAVAYQALMPRLPILQAVYKDVLSLLSAKLFAQ